MKILKVEAKTPVWYEHQIKEKLSEEEKPRASKIVEEYRDEWLDKFTAELVQIPGVQPIPGGKLRTGWSGGFTFEVVDYKLTDVILLIGQSFGMNISEGYLGSVNNVKVIIDVEHPEDAMNRLINKMESAARHLTDSLSASAVDGVYAPGWNGHSKSPVPGIQLLHINEFCLLEDCCTDHLQAHISEGWRVVAVCPQESRRPDYVVGRYNANFDGNKIPTQARRNGLRD